MIGLVLDDPAQPALEFPLHTLALDVAIADRDQLGASDHSTVVGHREAPLRRVYLPMLGDDLGVADGKPPTFVDDHGDLQVGPNLRPCQPHPVPLVAALVHGVHQVA
jgi:hypothetical protein